MKNQNNLINFVTDSLSSNNSLTKENKNSINLDNNNSSSFLNEKINLNNIKEYKIEFVDFSNENNDLISYYDNFYL